VDYVLNCERPRGFLIASTHPAFMVGETKNVATENQPTGTAPEKAGRQEQDLLRAERIEDPHWEGKQLQVAVGQAIEKEQQMAVPFAVLNSSARTIEVLPPQIQLSGTSKGKHRKAIGKEGSICLIPKPEIADGIDRKFPASHRKRRRESLHNVSTCWTVLLSSLRTCGRQVSHDSSPHCTSRSLSSRRSRTHGASAPGPRLIAELFAGLRGIPAEDATVEETVQVSNVVVPCFLLELGRRRQHIEIEFPSDPCDSAARFGLRAGPSCPIHSISSEQLLRLVAEAGEELVGLCYFGDQRSRENIAARPALKGSTTDS
jgi:hypothetical protein